MHFHMISFLRDFIYTAVLSKVCKSKEAKNEFTARVIMLAAVVLAAYACQPSLTRAMSPTVTTRHIRWAIIGDSSHAEGG